MSEARLGVEAGQFFLLTDQVCIQISDCGLFSLSRTLQLSCILNSQVLEVEDQVTLILL